jgi:hypothetical protein
LSVKKENLFQFSMKKKTISDKTNTPDSALCGLLELLDCETFYRNSDTEKAECSCGQCRSDTSGLSGKGTACDRPRTRVTCIDPGITNKWWLV